MRVFATRPEAQNTGWIATLEAAGFEVLACPLLDIQAITEASATAAIRQQVSELDRYDIVIFVSQNAVHFGFEYIADAWPQIPARIEWLAIGEKTHRRMCAQLHAFGHGEALCSASGQMTSEALLASEALLTSAGKKVLVFRGLGGRAHLGERLERRGASVDYCEMYTRATPASAAQGLAQNWPRPDDVIPVFSGDSLHSLDALSLDMEAQNKAGALGCPGQLHQVALVVPGKRVAEIAKGLGYTNIVIADNASEASMLKAIIRHKALLE